MTIEKTMEGNTVVLSLNGWMDTQSAPELADALNKLDEGVEALVLDLAGLEYTSSAGVRQIVAAYKRMNGAMTLRHVSAEVVDVLHMTGVDRKVHIEV